MPDELSRRSMLRAVGAAGVAPALVGSASGDPPSDGTDWVARGHARTSGIIGEFWMVDDGDVVSINAQPHTWEQTLFYLASLEAYPPRRSPRGPTRPRTAVALSRCSGAGSGGSRTTSRHDR